MKSSKNSYGNNQNINFLTYNDYFTRLQVLALNMFQWDGLPETCNERFLEKSLFERGTCLFFYDKTLGYMNLNCTKSGYLNNYNEPTYYTAYSPLYTNNYTTDESILIRNNILEYPTVQSLKLFATRLTDTERTIDVNMNAQKTPVLVACATEKERLSMLNMYAQYEGNEPFIMYLNGLNVGGISVLKTDAPYLVDKLEAHKKTLWNETLTFLGINNNDTEKRERMLVDEVNANNDLISDMANTMLSSRQDACKQINEMFSLNVSVRLKNERKERGGEEDGEVYNGITRDSDE